MTIHETAIIARSARVSPSAKVGARTKVDEHAYVGDECEVGEDAIIGASAVLRPKTKIGDRTIFGALSISEGQNQIGSDVTIQSHCNIAIGMIIEDGAFIGPYFCAMNTKQITPGVHGTRPTAKPVYEVNRIGRNARVGGQCAMTPGHVIGAEAVIDQHTFITKDIPPGAHVRNQGPQLLFIEGEKQKLGVNDAHIHLGQAIDSEFSYGDLQRAFEKHGIENAVVMAGDAEPEQVNKRIVGLARIDKRLRPLHWLTVNDKPNFIGFQLREGEISGVKYHGTYNKMPATDLRLASIWDTVADRQGVALVHCGMYLEGAPESNTSYLHALELASRHQKMTIILAHMGGSIPPVIRKCVGEIEKRGLKNVYLDTSGMVPRTDLLEMAAEKVDADKILFGSDLPLCSFNGQRCLVQECNLSEKQKDQILRSNFDLVFPGRKN